MPLVQITLARGRTPEQLAALGAAVTAAVEESIGAPKEAVRVVVNVVDGSYTVSDPLCPHNKGPLVEGQVDGYILRCPWHWYRFDLSTGACLTQPTLRLAVYPVRRDGDGWVADVGEKPVAMSMSQRLRAHARGETP